MPYEGAEAWNERDSGGDREVFTTLKKEKPDPVLLVWIGAYMFRIRY